MNILIEFSSWNIEINDSYFAESRHDLRNLPNNGTASEVAGIVSATIFKNTVNDNKIVTPTKRNTFNSWSGKCFCQ